MFIYFELLGNIFYLRFSPLCVVIFPGLSFAQQVQEDNT